MAASAKSNLKRVSLELGGKSPIVIFDDVDGMSRASNFAYLFSLYTYCLMMMS